MRLTETTLRRLIRSIIVEATDNPDDELPYEDAGLPGEEDDGGILGVDMSEEPERREYLQTRQKDGAKKKKARLRSRAETEELTGDEHAIAGHMDMSGYDGRDRPHGGKPLRSRNAMGDEYDE